MRRSKWWIRHTGVAGALFACLCAVAATLPHADGADDVACIPVPVAHDQAAHHIGAAPTPAQNDADHCFLCHSLRSFHRAITVIAYHDNVPHAEPLHLAPADRAGLIEWTLVPGRAPPA